MPRKTRSSTVLEKTEKRLIGLKSINSNLDFGDSISLNHLTELTGQLRNQIDQYNMMLTDLDTAKGEIEILEKTIRETSERLVNGVASRYGKNSREYEMTGGVRKSDACGGLRLRIRKATITRLKSTADSKAASTQTA
ncbi:MAG: hypothetical protein KME32_16780 [Mojavia pulchra JT2-VF2]|jgi:hypothetical protein|uniref:Uncharacterized protein n=1 Tax=Mojavia pulchra JT2-VF2 TaxID=287848 RepID=A0A951Q020_9NOST|nr:hypothetical protein [Mojavia pulchra JT2-VF2]